MKKLIAIGEALIDFIPSQSGRIQDIPAFEPHVGGAPCNVCGAFARLGGSSAMITQLGQDPFGDKMKCQYWVLFGLFAHSDQMRIRMAAFRGLPVFN